MKKYRGYYIDHVIFHSEANIDAKIREDAIIRYKKLVGMFAKNSSMELSVMMSDHARYMHDTCGVSYEEIEEIEIEVFKAA